jgi:hypothetical protein
MSKIVYLILLAAFLIPAGVFAAFPDCQPGGANTTGGVCTAGTGLLTGPGMMRPGSDTCCAGNASAGYCGSASGACDIGGKNYTNGDNDSCGMMGGDGRNPESGYRGMMGNRAPVSATGAGMYGLVAVGCALVIVLIVTWIIVGILLILALYKKLSTK